MTAELHAHASLTVTGVADLLDRGRDPEAVDELHLAAVLRRGGMVRLTAEILRLPKTDDDDGLAVEFMADVDRETLVRLGRMLLALADEREATPTRPPCAWQVESGQLDFTVLRPGDTVVIGPVSQVMGGGCASCPHATMRFNGGNGATTCELLSEKVVAYGTRKPTTAPSECPRLATDDCETTP